MANNLEMVPVEVLFNHLRILETTNDHMAQLGQALDEIVQRGDLGQAEADDTKKILMYKIEINNEIIENIEKRLFKSMRRHYGNAVLPNDLMRIEENIRQSVVKYKESLKPKKDMVDKLKKGKLSMEKPKMDVKK